MLPLLIDGNNLLFAARAAEDPDRPYGRALLCHALGHWAALADERIHVVFDGPAPAPHVVQQIGHENISLTFSGSGRTADAVIQNILETDSAARRLQVVSTDREIRRAAKRRKAEPIRSEVFWQRVARDLRRPQRPRPAEPDEKRRGLDADATETWLREFGFGD